MEGVREREGSRFEIENFFLSLSEDILDTICRREEIIFISSHLGITRPFHDTIIADSFPSLSYP
jgi:predicted helicase